MDEGQFLSLRVGKQPDLTIYYDHRPIPPIAVRLSLQPCCVSSGKYPFLNSTVRPEPVSV